MLASIPVTTPRLDVGPGDANGDLKASPRRQIAAIWAERQNVSRPQLLENCLVGRVEIPFIFGRQQPATRCHCKAIEQTKT